MGVKMNGKASRTQNSRQKRYRKSFEGVSGGKMAFSQIMTFIRTTVGKLATFYQ